MIGSKNPSQTIFLLFLLIILVLSSGANSWLVQAHTGDDARGELLPGEGRSDLLVRFDEQERLRVIVQLRVGGQTKSGELMTSSIHQAQGDVLGEVKSGQLRVIHEYDYIPFMALEVDRAAFEALQNNPNVIGIEEDVLMKPMLTESVPLIGADDVWLEGVTGAGQVVAILDTGVDKNHPALVGKVVEEACYSTTNALEGSTSLCPDGVQESTADESGMPCDITGCEHGTHVAGIVAGNNDVIQGVAKDSKLIAIQVFSLINGGSLGSWSTDQIRGLERVYALKDTYNIASVNLSLGSVSVFSSVCDNLEGNQAYKQAVDNLRDVGIATVAASGNEGSSTGISSPACISSVISVGATTKYDEVAYYSNSTSFLDLLAPGGDYDGYNPEKAILSTIPNNGYGYMVGTSMAAPHVAGAWALMKSYDDSLDVDYLLNVFKITGKLITDPGNGLDFPRIDVFEAYSKYNELEPYDILASDGLNPVFVSLTWSEQSNVTYKVYRNIENSPDTATLLASGLVLNSYDDASANPGTIYYYWVKACNNVICSDFSTPDTGWRDYVMVPAPEGVSASDGEFTDKVQVSWYGIGDADSYAVFRNLENSFDDAEEMGTTTTMLSFDDLTAESGENYYYWVKACVDTTCSNESLSDVGFRLEFFNVFLPLTIK